MAKKFGYVFVQEPAFEVANKPVCMGALQVVEI
jgi:hypothetical protein